MLCTEVLEAAYMTAYGSDPKQYNDQQQTGGCAGLEQRGWGGVEMWRCDEIFSLVCVQYTYSSMAGIVSLG